MFNVYLGNIPADVVLEEVRINGKPLLMSDTLGIVINPVVHVNGSQAYELRLPFEDTMVQWTVRTLDLTELVLTVTPDFDLGLFMKIYLYDPIGTTGPFSLFSLSRIHCFSF